MRRMEETTGNKEEGGRRRIGIRARERGTINETGRAGQREWPGRGAEEVVTGIGLNKS